MGEESAETAEEPNKISIPPPSKYWTNRSVVKLAEGGDPVETIVRAARAVVLGAVEAGWSGPPFDPFQLANHLGIPVMPREDVADARLVPSRSTSVSIEFNPNNPRSRTRFSVAHELAHTLFQDYAQEVRMRGQPRGDNWQLELLCNIAAAEFLMPIGTGSELKGEAVDIENMIRLRKQFDVSTEALFLRIVKLTEEPCAVFAAARLQDGTEGPVFRIDYIVPSRSWSLTIPRELRVTGSTVLSDCTAVGFTSRGTEKWNLTLPEFVLECVGIPPYPGDLYPRVIGILRLRAGIPIELPRIVEVRGDATQPRGSGPRVIAHIVNDKTPNWGAGFSVALKKKWPVAQEDFIRWTDESKSHLMLGNTHQTQLSEDLTAYHMIAQHGYGPSPKPRIRYIHLKTCLDKLAEFALGHAATVHMPRIGTGHAGGQWNIVRELVDEGLVRRGVEVTVYELPESERPRDVQGVLSPRPAKP